MLLFKSLLIHYIRNWHGDERCSENAQIYLSFLTKAVLISLNPLWLDFLLTFLPEVFLTVHHEPSLSSERWKLIKTSLTATGSHTTREWIEIQNAFAHFICNYYWKFVYKWGTWKNKYFTKAPKNKYFTKLLLSVFPAMESFIGCENATKRQIRFYLQLLSKHGFPKKFHQ